MPCDVTGSGRSGSPHSQSRTVQDGVTGRWGARQTWGPPEPCLPKGQAGLAVTWALSRPERGPGPVASAPRLRFPTCPVALLPKHRDHSESSSCPLIHPLIHLFTPEFLWHTLSATPHGPWVLDPRCEGAPLPPATCQACRARVLGRVGDRRLCVSVPQSGLGHTSLQQFGSKLLNAP